MPFVLRPRTRWPHRLSSAGVLFKSMEPALKGPLGWVPLSLRILLVISVPSRPCLSMFPCSTQSPRSRFKIAVLYPCSLHWFVVTLRHAL